MSIKNVFLHKYCRNFANMSDDTNNCVNKIYFMSKKITFLSLAQN